MKCPLCTTDTSYIHLLQFLQEPDEAGSAIFEDTEALQPKPRATKLALESRLCTPGAV